jgi:AcrR family transcriptional regulator
MLAELCALTGWQRDHARKARRVAVKTKRVERKRKRCGPVDGPEVLAPLRKVWAVRGGPAGKRLTAFLGEIVGRLRVCGELDIDDATAAKLCAMSAATIDRRLACEREKMQLKGHSLTKPGALLKRQIPIRTWRRTGTTPQTRAATHAWRLVPDLDRDRYRHRLDRAPRGAQHGAQVGDRRVGRGPGGVPAPVLGIDSGGEFINDQLLRFGQDNTITFTRLRPRTTAPTWRRRTGRRCAWRSGTTVTAQSRNCCCSTRATHRWAADQLHLTASEAGVQTAGACNLGLKLGFQRSVVAAYNVTRRLHSCRVSELDSRRETCPVGFAASHQRAVEVGALAKLRGVSFGKTEQTILETAGELFDRKGFNQTSLQDIADEIGMARPSLYHYFDNREQILAAGIDLVTKQRDAVTEALRELDGDPLQRLNALMLGLGTLITEHPVWVRITLRDEAALPEEARVRDRESRLAFFELLVETLKAAGEVGYLRAHDERATAMTIVSALSGLQGHYAATTDTSPEEATRLTVDVILHGIVDPSRRPGTPIERGLQLIRDGLALIERANPPS